MAKSVKKGRGRKTWAKGSKLEFLESFKEEYLATADTGGLYTKITTQFIDKYGYDLPHDEDASDTPPIIINLANLPYDEQETEQERRDEIYDSLRLKIGNWLRHKYKRKQTDQDMVAELLNTMSRLAAVCPRRRNAMNIYWAENYGSSIKKLFDAHWKKVKSTVPPELRMSMCADFVRAKYEDETEEFRKALELRADTEYTQALDEYNKRDALNGSPEAYAHAWNEAENFLPVFVDAVAKKFGMSVSLLLVGPLAAEDGNIAMRSVHSHNVGAMTKFMWPEYDNRGFTSMQASLIRYGEAVFSPEERRRRLGLDDEPNVTEPMQLMNGPYQPPTVPDPDLSAEHATAEHATPQLLEPDLEPTHSPITEPMQLMDGPYQPSNAPDPNAFTLIHDQSIAAEPTFATGFFNMGATQAQMSHTGFTGLMDGDWTQDMQFWNNAPNVFDPGMQVGLPPFNVSLSTQSPPGLNPLLAQIPLAQSTSFVMAPLPQSAALPAPPLIVNANVNPASPLAQDTMPAALLANRSAVQSPPAHATPTTHVLSHHAATPANPLLTQAWGTPTAVASQPTHSPTQAPPTRNVPCTPAAATSQPPTLSRNQAPPTRASPPKPSQLPPTGEAATATAIPQPVATKSAFTAMPTPPPFFRPFGVTLAGNIMMPLSPRLPTPSLGAASMATSTSPLLPASGSPPPTPPQDSPLVQPSLNDKENPTPTGTGGSPPPTPPPDSPLVQPTLNDKENLTPTCTGEKHPLDQEPEDSSKRTRRQSKLPTHLEDAGYVAPSKGKRKPTVKPAAKPTAAKRASKKK